MTGGPGAHAALPCRCGRAGVPAAEGGIGLSEALRRPSVSLTGSVVGWGTVLLTLVAFGAVMVLWPRLAARGHRSVIRRVGVLLVVDLLVLLTASVRLNDQFLFFADWSDLAGALAGTTTTTGLHRGATD